jgi:TRAP-type C4-dicarboxylate transport system permease small subunit
MSGLGGGGLARIARGFAVLGGLCAAAAAAMVVVSIIGRAGWAKPIQGDVELTQFAVALCISLCLPWAQVHRANIIVDFFTQRASPQTQQRLDRIGALLLALMVALLAWRTAVGAVAVREAHEASMILDLPMWWTYAMLAPGLALTALIALVQAVTGDAGTAPQEATP